MVPGAVAVCNDQPVSVAEFALLLVAGIAGGLFGTIAGLASLATYPALLAVGLSPVTANVTNTVALVFTGIGSVLSSRPELTGQAPRIRRLAPMAVLGGVVGAVLLLSTPADGFEKIVPALIGFASLTIVVPRRPPPDDHVAAPPRASQRSRVSEYEASGVPGAWKRPRALAYSSTSRIRSRGRPESSR